MTRWTAQLVPTPDFRNSSGSRYLSTGSNRWESAALGSSFALFGGQTHRKKWVVCLFGRWHKCTKRFGHGQPGSRGRFFCAVRLLELSIDHARFPTRDAYPFDLRIVRETTTVSLDAGVTFFAGENGSGKSTLLRALAHRCGIHIWENSERTRARHNPFAERLYECLDLRWKDSALQGSFFAAENFRNFAELVDAWAANDPGLLAYFGGSSLTEKSHGQCNMAFFESRFRVPGLYLLDEPEIALSPRRQLELLRILAEASGRGDAQFVVATHSPILMSLPGSRILSFDACPVSEIAYHETDSFRLHRKFFDKGLR